MVEQISIFAENKKGSMREITELLTKNDLNIYCAITNDSAEYGIVRMVTSDTVKACDALKAAGFLCRLTDVIGVEMADEVGAMNKLLNALFESNINLDYIYLSFNRDSGLPVQVFHTDEPAEVSDCLKAKGFTVI